MKPKTKPRTKLVPIGWCNIYQSAALSMGAVFDSKKSARYWKRSGLGAPDGYIDTVRVFAEVPVKSSKKGTK